MNKISKLLARYTSGKIQMYTLREEEEDIVIDNTNLQMNVHIL